MNTEITKIKKKPIILAPAGDTTSFLAAISAGADAIYCGLKYFSARRHTVNFTVQELAQLTSLAHQKKVAVYLTLNSLIKTSELDKAATQLDEITRFIKPDALIIQDFAFIEIVNQVGYKGELHLSTLANVSFLAALKMIKSLKGIHRVVIPRELSIDEMKQMSDACPQGIQLETFIHGALCYAISGRCYWSSYLGGKSGLRGRCVQPCRRMYQQKGQKKRYFSCQDLSLDVLVKVLSSVENICAWKIEGRKKGPHYVYNTVMAYRLMRDEGHIPEKKKLALAYLETALGRVGTHYNFLPQRPQTPVRLDIQTGSGLYLGVLQGAKRKLYLSPRQQLLQGDLLRIGYEENAWHQIYKVIKSVPKRGRLYVTFSTQKRAPVPKSPVFLIDRRDKELGGNLAELEIMLKKIPEPRVHTTIHKIKLPKKTHRVKATNEMVVYRKVGNVQKSGFTGFWMPEDLTERNLRKKTISKTWWWLPVVIWPENETIFIENLTTLLKMGARNFVLNAPWQLSFFNSLKGLNLWAGPFCNVANPLAIKKLEKLGFSGVIVSSELSKEAYFLLGKHSVLPLGIVLSGNFPLCISRTVCSEVQMQAHLSSPKGEQAWVSKYGDNYWLFPDWPLNISMKKGLLQNAGFSLFIHLKEPLPRHVEMKNRPGLWNWNLKLL